MRSVLAFVILIYIFTISAISDNSDEDMSSHPLQYHFGQTQDKGFVPVDLFVISKCPDAVYCENVFNQVLHIVKVPVRLDINYIAEFSPNQPYQHICKHGESECLGNIQQLCYHNVYPKVNQWFQFNLCLNKHYRMIGLNNSLAKSCAYQLNTLYEPVEKCTQSELGASLLIESAQKTKALQVSKSCTIFIDNKLRCIHDSSWKDCEGGYRVEDFVRSIEEAYYRRHQ
ncbi:unnamed protein product [Cunninghamella blakesleeana]